MNDDPTPLEPHELDELLSADLDGELAAAARDQNADVDTIRARIAVTPDAAERRAALAAARETLAEPPELDDLVAARLRAKAGRAASSQREARDVARRDRRKRVLLAATAAAASIVVVGAIAVALGRPSSSSTSNQSASAAPPTSGPKINLTAPVPTLGSYTDINALESVAVNASLERAAKKLNLGREQLSTLAPANTPPKAAPTIAVNGNAGLSYKSAEHRNSSSPPVPDTASGSQRALDRIGPSCSAAEFAPAADRLSMQASATLQGRPVQVYVFAGDDGHTVVVLGAGCTLVNRQTVG